MCDLDWDFNRFQLQSDEIVQGAIHVKHSSIATLETRERRSSSNTSVSTVTVSQTNSSHLLFVLAPDIWCNFEGLWMLCADLFPCVWCVCTVYSGLYIFECVDSSVWSSVLKHKEARYCSSPRDAAEIDGIHTLCVPPPPPPPPFKLPAPPSRSPYTNTLPSPPLTSSPTHTHTPTSLFLSLIISCGHEPK